MPYIDEKLFAGALLCKHNDCIHAAKTSGSYSCNYILDTKHKRPCKATPECTEYVKGKHKYKEQFTKKVPDYWGKAQDYET